MVLFDVTGPVVALSSILNLLTLDPIAPGLKVPTPPSSSIEFIFCCLNKFFTYGSASIALSSVSVKSASGFSPAITDAVSAEGWRGPPNSGDAREAVATFVNGSIP